MDTTITARERGTRIALLGANKNWIHVLYSYSVSHAKINIVLEKENAVSEKSVLALETEFGGHGARAVHQT